MRSLSSSKWLSGVNLDTECILIRKIMKTVGSDLFCLWTQKLSGSLVDHRVITISEWKINSMGLYTTVTYLFKKLSDLLVCKSQSLFTLKVKVAQSCPTLGDPMDHTVH